MSRRLTSKHCRRCLPYPRPSNIQGAGGSERAGARVWGVPACCAVLLAGCESHFAGSVTTPDIRDSDGGPRSARGTLMVIRMLQLVVPFLGEQAPGFSIRVCLLKSHLGVGQHGKFQDIGD